MHDWGRLAVNWAKGLMRDPGQFFAGRKLRSCTVCGFTGKFMSAPGRRERRCPNCGSRERDRIIGLHLQRTGLAVERLSVLHFAPEGVFYRRWRAAPRYVAADIVRTRTSERRVDITAIDFADGHFDLVICNHVLEHVEDDGKAMAELFRVLKPGGTAIISVPLAAGRLATWTPPPDMPRADVDALCGFGHLRLYGLDVEDRLRRAGFSVVRIAFTQDENQRHGLAGEIVQICRRPVKSD